jgi:hypothetical protein
MIEKKTFYDAVWDFLNLLVHGDPGAIVLCGDEVKEERMKICGGCKFYKPDGNICGECGCALTQKIQYVAEKCPIDKWGYDKTQWEERMDQFLEQYESR